MEEKSEREGLERLLAEFIVASLLAGLDAGTELAWARFEAACAEDAIDGVRKER